MKIYELKISDILTDIIRDESSLSACYILFQNSAISRFGTVDTKGILYIGKADNLLSRVPSLQDSVLYNCQDIVKPIIKGHQALSRKVFRIKHLLDSSKMTIKILALPNIESNHYLESYLLEKYVIKYGELPPLNGQYGKYDLIDSENYLAENNITFKLDFLGY